MKYVHPPARESAFDAELRRIFFAAMRRGYAAQPKKTTIAQLPGSKVITYTEGIWEVVDTYVVHERTNGSSGMMIMFSDGIPVWSMQYMGTYRKEALPCLRAALRAAYETGEFWGGRGLPSFPHGKYLYTNVCCNPTGDWTESWDYGQGREEVRKAGRCVGWHQYKYMKL